MEDDSEEWHQTYSTTFYARNTNRHFGMLGKVIV
jgi:hypothetical protein